MKSNFFKTVLDKIGVGLSATCLVHCLLLPIILSVIPFVSFLSILTNPVVEVLMITFAIINALFVVVFGHEKHKNYFTLTLFITGISLLLLRFIASSFVMSNEYVITIGAFSIGLGHFFNSRLCNHCKTCQLDHHE